MCKPAYQYLLHIFITGIQTRVLEYSTLFQPTLNTIPERDKRCLLILQKSFHSFTAFLTDALTAKGFDVVVANDFFPDNIVGKVMAKLRLSFIYGLTYKHIEEKYLNNQTYDLAIIIRGRGLSKELIERLKGSASMVVGYNWDTFDFETSALKWFGNCHKYYTFDYADADQYQIPIVELFSAVQKLGASKPLKYELSAVGKNYPGRLKYINRVIDVLKPNNVLIRLHDGTITDRVRNFLSNPLLYLKYRRQIDLRPGSYDDYIDGIQSSRFTIDYANDGQTGITMRCYETIALQTNIISNNPNMFKSSCFNGGNTLIFEENDDDDSLLRAYKSFKGSTPSGTIRTIDDFINDLIA